MKPKFLVGIDCIFSRKLFSVELDLKQFAFNMWFVSEVMGGGIYMYM